MSTDVSRTPLSTPLGMPPPGASPTEVPVIPPQASVRGRAAETPGFIAYRNGLIHAWAGTTAALGFSLIPLFFILDIFTMPAELLVRFAWYRGIVTLAVLAQFFVIKRTRPSRWSYLHGYLFGVL